LEKILFQKMNFKKIFPKIMGLSLSSFDSLDRLNTVFFPEKKMNHAGMAVSTQQKKIFRIIWERTILLISMVA